MILGLTELANRARYVIRRPILRALNTRETSFVQGLGQHFV